jgi:hypothetical protein
VNFSLKTEGTETKGVTKNFELHDFKLSKHIGEYNNHLNLVLPVLYYKHGDGNKFNTDAICTSGNYCMQIKITLNIKIIN